MKNKNNTGNGSKSTRIITGLEGAVAQAIASWYTNASKSLTNWLSLFEF